MLFLLLVACAPCLTRGATLEGEWAFNQNGSTTLSLFVSLNAYIEVHGQELSVAMRWRPSKDGGQDVWENITTPYGPPASARCNSACPETSKFFGENPFLGFRYAKNASRKTCAVAGRDEVGIQTLELTETWTPTGSMGTMTVQATRSFALDPHDAAAESMTLVITRSTRRRMSQALRFVRPAAQRSPDAHQGEGVEDHGDSWRGDSWHGDRRRASTPRQPVTIPPRYRSSTARQPKRAFSMALDDDWTFGRGLPDKILLLSLQAWANAPPSLAQGAPSRGTGGASDAPVLYFDYPADWEFTYTAALHRYFEDDKGYDFEALDPSDLSAALHKVPHTAEAYVVWDVAAHESLNVALTAAGVHRALVVTDAHVPLMRSLGLKEAADFRGRFVGNETVDVQRWAWQTYGPRTNRSLVVMNGGPCCSGAEAKPAVADFGISRGAFFMSLNTKPDGGAEYNLAAEIFGAQERYSLVMGWHKYGVDLERNFVTLASSFTLRVEGLHTLPNMGFMNRVAPEPGFIYRNQHSVQPGQVVTPEANKTYVALVQTDSIGLGAWVDPERGALPYAWETPVNYVWLAPAVLEYFYSQATPNDYFIGAISGPGYMYPRAIPPNELPRVVELASGLMAELDLRVWETMDDSHGATVAGSTDLTRSVAQAYLDGMPDLLGMVHGYGPSFTFGEGGPSSSKRPLLSFDYYLDPKPSADECAADLEELAALNFGASGGVGPYFCVVHVREWSGIGRVKSVLEKLDPDHFRVVPLDTLLAMASQKATFKTHYADDDEQRPQPVTV